MKLIPQGGAVASLPSDAPSATAQPTARDRAIAALIGSPAKSAVEQNAAAQAPAEVLMAQANASKATPDASQPDTNEAPAAVEPAAAEPDKSSQLDSQYAILARKEKQLRLKAQQERQALADREAQLAAKEAELRAKEQEYRDGYISKSRLKAESLQVLAEEGISYDELTNQILNAGKTDPATMAMLQKLERATQELKDQQAEIRRQQAESTQAQYQEALQQIELDTRRLVKADPNFELISITPGAVKEVVKLIEKTYTEDKILLTVEEASEMVENELVQRSLKIAKAKKLQKLQSAAQPKAPAQQAPATPAATSPTVKTLTNSVGSTRQLSARERAIAVFKGELK